LICRTPSNLARTNGWHPDNTIFARFAASLQCHLRLTEKLGTVATTKSISVCLHKFADADLLLLEKYHQNEVAWQTFAEGKEDYAVDTRFFDRHAPVFEPRTKYRGKIWRSMPKLQQRKSKGSDSMPSRGGLLVRSNRCSFM
jgi:hypothetical protein